MGRLFVHVYHSGEYIVLADLLLHKGYCLGKIGLDVLSAPSLEELRAGSDKGVHKHGAVFPYFAARRFDPAADLLPVFLRRGYDVKIVFTPCRVYIGVAGVFLLRALVVRLQRTRRSRLVFGKA